MKAISRSCGVKNVLNRSFRLSFIGINSLIACVFAWPEFALPESEIFFRAKVSCNRLLKLLFLDERLPETSQSW